MTLINCYKCEKSFSKNELLDLFDYSVCKSCKSDLGLFQDKTIKRHLDSFDESSSSKFGSKTYEEEINNRLNYIEKYYISSKIKLLHIKERLEYLK